MKMRFFILSNLILIVFSETIEDQLVEWNPHVISKTVKPDVRRLKPQPNDYLILPHYHYKKHFGIIIQQNTTFTLNVKSSKRIEDLFFHCLTSSAEGSYNEINLEGRKNYRTSMVSLADCVPMVSVSYNVPVEIIMKTRNWAELPVFDTQDVTFLTSKKAEITFFANIQTYGFVENYLTQMLISLDDVKKLRSANYSLYLGLQNQADLLQYYDYLSGSSRYINENERDNYNSLERSSIFLRTEPCNPKSMKNTDDGFSNKNSSDGFSIMSDDSSQGFNSNNSNIEKLGNKFRRRINPTIYDKCEEVKPLCNHRMSCNYYAYYSSNWVAIITDVSEFLHPKKGSEWVLLHEVGHNYNIAPYEATLVGLGNTMEVWNNIFATLYQNKFNLQNYWINSSILEAEETVRNYKNGIFLSLWDWRPKLHFFISLFGFDGTDSAFREFHIRYYKRSETTFVYFNNIIPTLLEVFLDLHNINILPYIRKVVNFHEFVIPLVNEDLELRLLSGNPVMPGIDFNLNVDDLQRGSSVERDLIYATPLRILSKMPKKYVWINFHINSPVILFGRCMYLNNVCYYILGAMLELRLLANVYSSYVSVKIGKTLFISDIEYHTIADSMTIDITVQKIEENDIFLPLIYYSIDAYGISNSLFARTFINYKNNEIKVSQFTDQIHYGFPRQVYHSVTLKRDDNIIFDHVFLGDSENDNVNFVNDVYRFEIGDVLYIYHREMDRMNINGGFIGYNGSSEHNTYLFTPVGIHNVENSRNEIIENDVKRIHDFTNKHKIDLSYNVMFSQYLERYARSLDNFSSSIEFPKEWLSIVIHDH